jgi:hypothetical protein
MADGTSLGSDSETSSTATLSPSNEGIRPRAI